MNNLRLLLLGAVLSAVVAALSMSSVNISFAKPREDNPETPETTLPVYGAIDPAKQKFIITPATLWHPTVAEAKKVALGYQGGVDPGLKITEQDPFPFIGLMTISQLYQVKEFKDFFYEEICVKKPTVCPSHVLMVVMRLEEKGRQNKYRVRRRDSSGSGFMYGYYLFDLTQDGGLIPSGTSASKKSDFISRIKRVPGIIDLVKVEEEELIPKQRRIKRR
jgi:hypothetical protein